MLVRWCIIKENNIPCAIGGNFGIPVFDLPILDENGYYISTISEGDILRYIKNNCNFDIKVAESVRINTLDKYRPYKALDINSKLEEVIRLSLEQNFVPVVDDRGVYIGIIKRKTIIDYLFDLKNRKE